MKPATKTSLIMGAWSTWSGMWLLYFADMADRGGHRVLAEAGLWLNGGQLAAALVVLTVIAVTGE